jgi:4-alpha-glucanotransferase
LRPSLDKLGLPGYRLLRWDKKGDAYRDPAGWPPLSVAANGTHDTETTAEWYENLSVEDRRALLRLPGLSGLHPEGGFDDHVRDALLGLIYRAPSILVLISFQDAMGSRERVNLPGTVGDSNWTYRMAMDIETLLADEPTTLRLAAIATATDRDPRGSGPSG